jgi:hypothetical protein
MLAVKNMLVAFSGNSRQATEPAVEELDKEQVRRMKRMKRTILRSALALAVAALFGITMTASLVSAPGAQASAGTTSARTAASYTPSKSGELDCNGFSPAQKEVRASECTDIRGIEGVDNSNTWGGKFYDNGEYIGHDEPDTTFLSSTPGSGNNVSWNLSIGRDPAALPTDVSPGHDISHWFQLSPAPWFSMALCDPNSYPQTPCTPESDSNAPSCFGSSCTTAQSGGGSTFMEMQLYPPGNPPFVDSASCDDTHWCAALTIDSLECTTGFATCNTTCEEPTNFGFIQKNGVPTGPPAPQNSDTATFTPNNETLLMNPGDRITIHMSDAPAPGGGKAFKVVIDDLTRHTSGSMQSSAANGFQTTSMATCAGTPFNFQPEFSTAKPANVIPWAALQTNISTEFETGHWESCTALSDPLTPNPIDAADTGGAYNECEGPYENAGPPDSTTPEAGDAMCYYAGDTHPGFDGPGTSTQPDLTTGCQDNFFQNGDLDFDGSPYWTEWPTGNQPTIYPSTFVEQFPTSAGRQYRQYFFQTDIALSESTCTATTLSGCTVPPQGPGGFYPYWTESHALGSCALEFGNVSGRGPFLTDFGKDAQYGQDLFTTLGYPEFEGPVHNNTCDYR